jgi:hypothetical protein
LAVGVVVTVAVATGCSNGAQPQSAPVQGATVPTAAPTTTTTNLYAVPDQIDAAYVNRVLAGLDAIEGDIFRKVRSDRTITVELANSVKDFYVNLDSAALLLNLFQFQMATNFEGYLPEPGDPRTTVADLITARPTCVYAQVERDYGALLVSGSSRPQTSWVAIRPMPTNSRNRTGWGYQYAGTTSEGLAPRTNPCDAF